MPHRPWRAISAEFVGTAILTTVVIGSGYLASSLTRDTGLALLMNAVSTVTALGLLIWALAPVSGAQFNPAVSLVLRLRGELSNSLMLAYIAAQCVGAAAGAALANTMYGQQVLSLSTTPRDGLGQLIGEVVATAGLVAAICLALQRGAGPHIPVLVPVWIASACLFTASTALANPAVTLGRVLTDSFTGIMPASAAGFIAAQTVGALCGAVAARALATPAKEDTHVITAR